MSRIFRTNIPMGARWIFVMRICEPCLNMRKSALPAMKFGPAQAMPRLTQPKWVSALRAIVCAAPLRPPSRRLPRTRGANPFLPPLQYRKVRVRVGEMNSRPRVDNDSEC